MIVDNIKNILERVESAKVRIGRKDGVKLVVVTKTISNDKIKEAIDCGIGDIGENRVQEAEKKYFQLASSSPQANLLGYFHLNWHLIGHLQTNKAKKAVEIFDLIQSVDSVHLLEEINKQAEKIGKIQECLVEIKISKEETKYGLNPDELEVFLTKAKELKNIKITGLMAIAPFFEDPKLARPYFSRAYKYYSLLATRYSLSFLSMGMTNDFEIAIEEGSNMVRIGTGIFGGRV